MLYVAGGLERLTELTARPAVTLVGGRQATGYALEVASALGHGLAAAGVTVVSGLALGVDAAAHRGALEAGTAALAVLGGGVDVPYPPSNRALYGRVRERGALVAELPPGTRPARWTFPARNRIMAALSRMTVVVEAGERSGSLITAEIAGDLGRDVGAVPNRVTVEKAAGSNQLLRDGAHVVRGARDVLDEICGAGRGGDEEPPPGPAGDRSPRGDVLRHEAGLEPSVRQVLEAVEAGHGVEAIGTATGLGPGEVRAALGRLEVMGLVARDGLGAYQRALDRH